MRAALAGALLLLTAACTSAPATAPEPVDLGRAAPEETSVVVDSPALRAQKADAGIAPCRAGTAANDGPDALPVRTLPCLGGGPDVDLNRLRGPLVINLFAQWCGPCRAELPFYQRLSEQGGEKVRVLGIDWQDPRPAEALTLAEDSGVTYPLLADPSGSLRSDFRIRGLPGVVFVDAEGGVSAIEYTVIRDYAELTSLVEEHLGLRL